MNYYVDFADFKDLWMVGRVARPEKRDSSLCRESPALAKKIDCCAPIGELWKLKLYMAGESSD